MPDRHIPKAAEIMTRKVVTLRPDMSVLNAQRLLVEHRISGAPVLDTEGRVVGIVTEFDCLRILAAGQFSDESRDEDACIGDIMTRNVESIAPDLDLFSIAHRFLKRPIRRVPVVENGRLVGLVSRRDVLLGVETMRRRLREQSKPDRPKGLYLSASDPQGDEIARRLK